MAATLPAIASRMMPRGIYDSNDNNIVDTVDQLSWNDVLQKPLTFPPTAHRHPVDAIQGLSTSLAGKSEVGHTHSSLYYTHSEIQELLALKAAANHTHSTLYYSKVEINALLQGLASSSHDHDDLYYTKEYIDDLIEDNIANTHNHDNRYYTETETNSLLSGKSNSGHNHDDRYYTEDEIDALFATVGVGDITFEFLTPAATWTVTHNLNRHPGVVVLDTNNAAMLPNVVYTDSNVLVIQHLSAVAGRVYLT